ncbi:hemolysin-III family protein [Apiospora kogelbergensis]|uniref:Hemolysin-III family protein n=1 Tax=Apiospora kogelbergensis TaxID=1337665 RepID=A0AAW0R2C7_9PEZI
MTTLRLKDEKMSQPTLRKELSPDGNNESPSWHNHARLLSFHEIPAWQQDNEYIPSGYRPTSGSVWRSLQSLSYLHNQTINAYTHLAGAAAFAALPLHFKECVYRYQPNRQAADLVVVSTYCLGLDYLGILVLMWGAGIPTIYYGCFCDPSLRLFYWMSTSGTAATCAILTLHPRFGSPKFRKWRACFYAGFGLSSIVFVAHSLARYGWDVQRSRMSLVWMGWMATSNPVGAAIYAYRVPERWAPRVFDVYGASHQIFHVAVMVAAWIHYDGLVAAFRLVRDRPDVCGIA